MLVFKMLMMYSVIKKISTPKSIFRYIDLCINVCTYKIDYDYMGTCTCTHTDTHLATTCYAGN